MVSMRKSRGMAGPILPWLRQRRALGLWRRQLEHFDVAPETVRFNPRKSRELAAQRLSQTARPSRLHHPHLICRRQAASMLSVLPAGGDIFRRQRAILRTGGEDPEAVASKRLQSLL